MSEFILGESDLQLTVDVPPVVILKDALTFSHGEMVLAAADAEYDLSTVRPDLHEMAVSIILQSRRNVCLSNIWRGER